MNSILKSLYGEYYMQQDTGTDSPEVKALWDQKEKMEQIIHDSLSPEMQELFHQYHIVCANLDFLEHGRDYAHGLALGGRMVMEMLFGPKL